MLDCSPSPKRDTTFKRHTIVLANDEAIFRGSLRRYERLWLQRIEGHIQLQYVDSGLTKKPKLTWSDVLHHEVMNGILGQFALTGNAGDLIESRGRCDVGIEAGGRGGHQVDWYRSSRALGFDARVDAGDKSFVRRSEIGAGGR